MRNRAGKQHCSDADFRAIRGLALVILEGFEALLRHFLRAKIFEAHFGGTLRHTHGSFVNKS